MTTKQGSRVRPLVEVTRVAISRHTQVSTRMPTLRERRELGVGEGIPVFVVERPDGKPEVFAGDRTLLIVD